MRAFYPGDTHRNKQKIGRMIPVHRGNPAQREHIRTCQAGTRRYGNGMTRPPKRTSDSVVIAGATSTHGWALFRTVHRLPRIPACNIHARGEFCRTWQRTDAEDTEGWLRWIDREQPTGLIYCAGVCDVEQCEAHPAWARRINVDAVIELVRRLPTTVHLVYVSSDHVFAGRDRPYLETDQPDPISHYGRLRVEVEQRILDRRPDALIVRPGLCVGPSPSGRKGHWDSLAYRLRRRRPVTIIAGEYRSAVWADDAAQRILDWTDARRSGIRHLTAERPTARPELADAICRARGLPSDYVVRDRATLNRPHLGKVELASVHDEPPLQALPDRLAGRRTAEEEKKKGQGNSGSG